MKYKSGPRGLTIFVKVQPGASKSAVVGIEGEYLKVRVAAPPVDSKANQELVLLLAKRFHVPKSRISIQSGISSRRKTLLLEALSEGEFQRCMVDLEKTSSFSK